ncbi:PAS domain S-box protein [Algibacter sp. R77976]|uniref:PAS domain S-box protein n=1 Tax=Algibacter sp. R77976 TaxID=3093873 RepID=UPI0037CBE078
MSLFITIFIEFLLISTSVLVLFKYRDKLGLAPLYLILGSMQYLLANSGKPFIFEFYGIYEIYPGFIILFSCVLFAVLLIYIKEGVASARALILGIIISNVIITLISEINYFQELIINQINNSATDIRFINKISSKYFLIGTALLLIDFFLMIILYQYLYSKIKKISFFLIITLSLFVTLIFDAFAFNFLVFFGTPIFAKSLISHLIGKSIAALVYATILYLYLKLFEKERTKSTSFIASQNRDIFSIIKYKKRYEELKIEKLRVEQKLTSQLETSLNFISDGFVTLDANWCYTYVNEKAAEFVGRSAKSLLGKHIWTEFPENVGTTFYSAYNKAYETQKTQSFEAYYESSDKWIESRVYPSSEGLAVYFTDITERKVAEENLIKSELKFRELTSNAPVGIFQTDKDGACNFVNDEWLKYSGLSFNEAMGLGWSNAIHPDDHDRVLFEWREAYSVKKDMILDSRFVSKAGVVTWMSIKAVGLYDANNELYGYLGMCLDITERKKIEEDLVNSETLFRRLTSQAPAGIFQTNLDGSCNYVNDKWTKYAGISFEEAMGYGWATAIHPDDSERISEEWEQHILTSNIELETEFRFQHKNKKTIWVSVRTVGTYDAQNNLNGYIGMAIDITERKKAEEKLIESELLFRGLTSNAPVGIFKTDIEGSCNFVNNQWMEHTGLSFNEAMGFGWSDGLHRDDKNHVIKAWREFVNNGKEYNIDLRFYNKKNDKTTWLSVKSEGLYDAKNELYGYIGTCIDITERKKAEEQVRESEKYLESIINNIGDPVYVKDAQNRVVLANNAFCSTFGMERVEILGRNLIGKVSQNKNEDFLILDRQVIDSGIEVIKEVTINQNKDESRSFSVKKTRFIDNTGNKFIIGVVRDLTDFKRANEEIRRAHQRLTTHLNNSPLAVIEWDKNLIIRNWSVQATNIFGWEESEAVGKHFSELNLVYKEEAESVSLICEDLMRGAVKSTSTINRNNTKANQVIYGEWYNSVLLSEDGQIETIFSLVQDVTERIDSEQKIRESEAKLSKVFQSNIIGFSIVNEDQVRVEVNETMAKMLETTKEHLIGKTFEEAKVEIHDDAYYKQKNKLHLKFIENGFLSNETISRTLVSGKKLSLLVSVEPLEISGKPHGLFAVIDISDRVKVELELEKYRNNLENLVEIRTSELEKEKVKAQSADLMKSAFLATMSHELRTPMNSIIGFTGVLLKEFVGPLNEEQKKQLGMVKNSSQHLLGLINDVLDISKIEAGKLKVSFYPFNYLRTLEKTIEFLLPQASKKGLDINFEIAEEDITLNSDERRVEQVLINLLSNAIKFSNKGVVLVKVEVIKDFVVTKVIDQGIGISKKHINKLFEPFVQIEGGLNRSHEGTGLGLAISKNLIEKLGGEIKVESKKDKGSCFSFTLPIK